MNDELAYDIVRMTIVFTCLGVFVATALATALNMFGLIPLERSLRRKLHIILITEIAAIAVATFRGYLEAPADVLRKVKTIQSDNRSAATELNLIKATAQSASSTSGTVNTELLRSITASARFASTQSLAGKQILWVDNHPQNNDYERRALSQLGLKFIQVTNTTDAIRELSNQPFQLVITNFARGTDPNAGYTLLSLIHRSQGQHPPVIIYSSSSDPTYAADAMKKGAFGETIVRSSFSTW